ncbi:MAG: RNA methyltransferase [Ignavibacteria bacterium]|nr:RNA methyltransferase [Ignavibacteria bacterium]
MQLSHNLNKYIRSLHDNHSRDQEQCFIVEGEKLCRELLTSSFTVECLVIRTQSSEQLNSIASEFSHKNIPVYTTDERGFKQISAMQTPQGILAIVRYALPTSLSGNLIILDGISDPGNLGTIIRTADWFGFHTLLLCGNSAHRYNPKTVRATMGSVFRTQIYQPENTIEFIQEHCPDYDFYGASLSATTRLQDLHPTSDRYALVFGSESHGISLELQKYLTTDYIIPAYGDAESLNVAVAAGISLYHFSNMG